jgi:hypothetical protein
MSLRKAAEDVVCLTTMHTAIGVIRKGPLLSSSDPHVKRDPHRFRPATLGIVSRPRVPE